MVCLVQKCLLFLYNNSFKIVYSNDLQSPEAASTLAHLHPIKLGNKLFYFMAITVNFSEVLLATCLMPPALSVR